jgi:maleylacetate reductase
VRPFVHDLTSPRIVFGPGTLAQVTEEADRLGGRRVLLVAGARDGGPGEQVAAALGERLAGRVSKVVMHVPVAVAARAVEAARRAGADLVVTVGGGSATGLGKAVARETALPVLAVPTTFAGSELTPVWGLTDGDRKTTGRDPVVQPRVVVYDPELLASLPADVAAASGLNALAHCVEALYGPGASPLVPVIAEEGLRVLAAALPRVVAAPGPGDVRPGVEPDARTEARSDALYGAWLGGTVLGAATMGLHHKLAHVLGGLGLPHAQVHAALLPYVIAVNAPFAPEAMARAARALGADPAGALWDLAHATGAPTSLAQLGLAPDAADRVADLVLEAPPVNPAPVDRERLLAVLDAARRGDRPSPPTSR